MFEVGYFYSLWIIRFGLINLTSILISREKKMDLEYGVVKNDGVVICKGKIENLGVFLLYFNVVVVLSNLLVVNRITLRINLKFGA